MPQPIVTIPVRRCVWIIGVVCAVVVLAGAASAYLRLQGHSNQLGLAHMLNLDREGNLPTWVGSTVLLISAALLALLSASSRHTQDGLWRSWAVLALVFLFLAIDEAASIHEQYDNIANAVLFRNDPSRYAALVVTVPAVALLALSQLRLFLKLPNATKTLFLCAGFLFLAGVWRVENVSYLFDTASVRAEYVALVVIEEAAELAGVLVFIYALLRLLRQSAREMTIHFE